MTARCATRRSRLVLATMSALAAIAMGAAAACTDVNTDPNVVASIAFDSIASPSIIAGDSLRDTLGVARPLHASAFNVQGATLPTAPIRYHAADAGVLVDSLLGYVVADTARSTPIRIIAQAAGLQTAPDTIFIVPAPDTVYAVATSDSALYSVRDTTPTLSGPLAVTVAHRAAGGSLVGVRGYLVSYRITYPADTLLAQLVGRDGFHPSRVDTTATDGTSGHRVRVRQTRLTAVNDSVIVLANVLYRGAVVPGAPIRFFVKIAPHP